MNVTPLTAPQQFAGRRIELVDNCHGKRRRREVGGRAFDAVERNVVVERRHRRLRRGGAGLRNARAVFSQRQAYGGGVQEIGGRQQPVSAAPDPFKR